MSQDPTQEITRTELERRLVYSLFGPAVRLASLFELPLREMKEWLGVSYLHELKRQGLTQKESARKIDVSRRTIIALTQKLRENFFEPERQEGLARRALFVLWAEPMTFGRLRQTLDVEPQTLEPVLAELEARGEISREETSGSPRYTLKRGSFRLYRDHWVRRIDALNNQLDHLANTVFSRFFEDGDAPKGFVRTVALSVRRQDLEAIERLYRDVIFPELVRLEQESQNDPDAELMELSMSWAPKDLIEKRILEQGDESS